MRELPDSSIIVRWKGARNVCTARDSVAVTIGESIISGTNIAKRTQAHDAFTRSSSICRAIFNQRQLHIMREAPAVNRGGLLPPGREFLDEIDTPAKGSRV